MKIAIIAIGTEVLAGRTINRNASFISHALSRLGYQIACHLAFPDHPDCLVTEFGRATRDYDLVITTGGLGPTRDDITRVALAEVAKSPLTYSDEVASQLVKNFGEHIPTLNDQATIPKGAIPLHNKVGTAPGLIMQVDKSTLIVLPGVPVEMQALFTEQVTPYLLEYFPPPKQQFVREVHLFQIPEATIDAFCGDLLEAVTETEYGIYPQLGVVNVRFAGEKNSVLHLVEALTKRFPNNWFDTPSGALEEAIQTRCIAKGWTVSVAESCTGGALAAQLTSRSGASEYFMGGVVSYSNIVKQGLLGVQEETLIKRGAVSEPTAREMVVGLLRRIDTDFGVAITGIAGPTGGTKDKPIGTVCFGAMRQGSEPVLSTIHAKGNRSSIITRSVNNALAEMWKLMRE